MKASPSEQKDLLRLQAIDSRAMQLTHQLANLPQNAAIASLTTDLEQIRGRLNQAAGDLDDAKAELSRLESDVAVVDARIVRDTDRAQATASAKDAQAFEAELVALRKRKADLEDIEITVMERVEEKEAALAAVELQRSATTDEVSVLEQERERARVETERSRGELGRDREAVAATIGDELLALYEKRRSVGGGIGAALLQARTCKGCNMALTGVDLEGVRKASADDVQFCPECGRILVRTEESGL